MTATVSRIESYAVEFARRNRGRTPDDMQALGVADDADAGVTTYDALSTRPIARHDRAMPQTVAAATWTGLESFTGEYRFQVEFPQAAGLVLKGLIRHSSNKHVAILCTAI